jgi:hypothetical protein
VISKLMISSRSAPEGFSFLARWAKSSNSSNALGVKAQALFTGLGKGFHVKFFMR